jgi:hypothetical protein
MRKCNYFLIYEEVVSHIWLCNCSTLNFLIYEETLFYFLSVYRLWRRPPVPALIHRLAITFSVNFFFGFITGFDPTSRGCVRNIRGTPLRFLITSCANISSALLLVAARGVPPIDIRKWTSHLVVGVHDHDVGRGLLDSRGLVTSIHSAISIKSNQNQNHLFPSTDTINIL